MKRIVTLLTLTLALTAPALAGPLQKEHISAEAKWFLHLDLDTLRGTKVGECLGREVLDKKLAKAKEDLKAHINFDFDWRRIASLTAYGTDYLPQPKGKAVLLMTTDMDARKALETVIEKFIQMGNEDGSPVKRLEPDPTPLYALNNDLYVAVLPGKPVILGKQQELVRLARQVLTGKAPNATASQAFLSFPAGPKACFFGAVAEGFNESAPIPPKAKILKMAESVRLVLGEAGDQVFLNLTLKAKSLEVSQQIQQVIQGVIALVALGQVDNPDLEQLAQGTKVTGNEKMVSVDLQYPVAKAIKKIEEKARQEENQ